ncbi:hypothetical protein RND71_036888 [Anisodus tanguticus]|uniref:Maturase n=1 Tax=Anisodus tanguticus TaxID=243964 RepID=A0AAE1V093_9SOLA|nr:hypothetical protein RND71_036888 [Anisodus tanguticus]
MAGKLTTRRHSGMDVDPSGRDNHFGLGEVATILKNEKDRAEGSPMSHRKDGRKRNKGRSLDRSRSSTYRKDHEIGDRMVLESIYDLEFPDTSHFHSGRGFYSVLRRIKEEWGASRWFLEFDIGSVFTPSTDIDSSQSLRKRSTIPSSFTPFEKVFSAGRLVGGEKGPYSVPHSVLLSALPGNIYLHKLDREIGRIR